MLRIAKNERSWDICGVILRSPRDRATDVPSHLASSVYLGTSVEQLRWDCNRLLSVMCVGSPGDPTRRWSIERCSVIACEIMIVTGITRLLRNANTSQSSF